MIVYPPGTPNWVDLSTTDLAASQAFYTEIFGWEVTKRAPDEANGGYWIFTLDGEAVAGLGASQIQGASPFWTTYVAVADADATAAKVEAAGGKVATGPFTIDDDGRMAVFVDGADGAMFAVWQPLSFQGAQAVNRVGAWVWSELNARDVEGAQRFYGDVFGWTFEPIEQDGELVYGSWRLDGRLIGGLLPMGPRFPPDVPANWVAYFGVDDVEAAGEHVRRLGGQVVAGPMDVPQGRFLTLTDPLGAVFALWQGEFEPPPSG
jgi:hypothetical protein